MSKTNKKVDINQMLIKAHKLGVEKAIDVSARSNTRLVVYEGGIVKEIKPKYRYVRVPSKASSRSRGTRRKKDA